MMVVAPPILASDILREEVAPKAPARRAIRLALTTFAATFALGAVAARYGLGPIRLTSPMAFEGALGTALVAGIAAVAPLSYTARAGLAAVAGGVPLLMAAFGLGPMAPLAEPAGEGGLATAAFAVMATLLPAALVFRARYRAFAQARVVLAGALVASLPAVVLLVARGLDPSGELGLRALSGAGVLVTLASTLGFMGPETSAGCARWAAFVVGALVARPAWRAGLAAWAGRDGEMIASTAAALGELMASTLVTFALFQLLASAMSDEARQVDVHKLVGAGASEPGPRLEERE